MTLQNGLLLVASGAIGYWPLYAFIESTTFRVAMLRNVWFRLSSSQKRIVVLVISVLLSLLAWICLVVLGYIQSPATGRAWLESMFDVVWKVGVTTFTASTIRHGREEERASCTSSHWSMLLP